MSKKMRNGIVLALAAVFVLGARTALAQLNRSDDPRGTCQSRNLAFDRSDRTLTLYGRVRAEFSSGAQLSACVDDGDQVHVVYFSGAGRDRWLCTVSVHQTAPMSPQVRRAYAIELVPPAPIEGSVNVEEVGGQLTRVDSRHSQNPPRPANFTRTTVGIGIAVIKQCSPASDPEGRASFESPEFAAVPLRLVE